MANDRRIAAEKIAAAAVVAGADDPDRIRAAEKHLEAARVADASWDDAASVAPEVEEAVADEPETPEKGRRRR